MSLNFRPLIPMGAVRDDANLAKYIADEDYIAEVKYDGYRMLGWFEQDRIRFTTRSIAIDTARAGNPMPTERTDNVPHLRDLKHAMYGTLVDGEFWKPGCTSHDMTSMLGGLPETSIVNQEREGYVIYVMYDILQYEGQDVTHFPHYRRRHILDEVRQRLLTMNPHMADYIRLSEIVPHKEKESKYEELVKNGGEGLILKHKDSLYYPGKIVDGKGQPSKLKASKSKGIPHTPWVKWKKYDTFDVVVMGFSPATREYTGKDVENWQYWEGDTPVTKFHYHGWPGAIIFGQYDKNGNLVEVGQTSGISDVDRAAFAHNPNLFIGKVAEVGAMERIKKTGALREPRFIRFRDDKNAWECIFE